MRSGGACNVKHYRERLQTALKAAKICVFEVDLRRQLYTFFENAEDIFGISGETILREVRPFSQLPPEEYRQAVSRYFSHPDDKAVIERAFCASLSGEPATYEARMRAGGSDFVWCKLDVTPVVENGKAVKMIGVITDISAARELTVSLKKQVRLDAFTGLYNKKYAGLAIEKILKEAPGSWHALLILDIDGFKVINDTYGHAAGDAVIQDVAGRLTDCFRPVDVVSRFGGDEFLILVRDLPGREWLLDRLNGLVACEHPVCTYTNSIGVSLFPQDAGTFDGLFAKADRALYHSKAQRRTYTFASAPGDL